MTGGERPVPEDDPYADWPDRTQLSGPDGRRMLAFSRTHDERADLDWADGAWRPPDVSAEDAAAEALDALPGWLLSTGDTELVEVLRRRGALERRHAHLMSLELLREPPLAGVPDGISVARLDADELRELADQIGAVAHAAHGDDGQGWESAESAGRDMRRYADGEVLGPLLDCSVRASRGDRVVGACLVVDRDGDPPYGGPWILDIVRDPAERVRGIGAAMLAQTARSARSAGLRALGLVVDHDNERARGLYARMGFDDLEESWTLLLVK